MFKIGSSYTRKEIHNIVDGSMHVYLPTKIGQDVAACLTKDYDPQAPKVILVGHGPLNEKAANLLTTHSSAIPVFLKKAFNSWEYQGMF
ncbi:MAG: hypothetical protein ABSA06_02940 [Geobacteraceae bacterium]|jgi:phosphohistidine phosphatase SixA